MTPYLFDAVVFDIDKPAKEPSSLNAASVEFIEALKDKGISVGMVFPSSSSGKAPKLSGVENLLDFKLKTGARGIVSILQFGLLPARSVAVERSPDGIRVARDSGFGLVAGLATASGAEEYFRAGADVIVGDLDRVDFDWIENWFRKKPLRLFSFWDSRPGKEALAPELLKKSDGRKINPCFLKSARDLILNGKKVVFIFDYDGTLSPAVKHPDLAIMSEDMRDALRRISEKHVTVVMSGRSRRNIEELVGIRDIFYAGNHGFEIKGPGISAVHAAAEKVARQAAKISASLRERLKTIPGLVIEEKGYSTSVHYRLAEERYLSDIQRIVRDSVKGAKGLRFMQGRKVYEIVPAIEWDKGKAVRWILENLGLGWDDSSVVYIGDDTTDEDAFRTVRARGTGILIAEEERISAADFYAISIDEVKETLEKLLKSLG